MSFLLSCPGCGERNVDEFRFGGEVTARPEPDAAFERWAGYLYSRKNVAGVSREWWNHRYGCGRWFQALRDSTVNQVRETFWP